MSLTSCSPFNCETYIEVIEDFIAFTVQYVQESEIKGHTGWAQQLGSYKWTSGNFQEGVNLRLDFYRRLRDALRSQRTVDLQHIVDEIMQWGGMKPYKVTAELLESFRILDSLNMGNQTDWQKLIGKRIAATSKIYAMYDLNYWTIYDARVAKGIQYLVSNYLKINPDNDIDDGYLRFQMPPARNRKPIKGFEGLIPCEHSKQAILGFLYASWLLRAIARRLCDKHTRLPAPLQDEEWQVYHVEMIFFMIGLVPEQA